MGPKRGFDNKDVWSGWPSAVYRGAGFRGGVEEKYRVSGFCSPPQPSRAETMTRTKQSAEKAKREKKRLPTWQVCGYLHVITQQAGCWKEKKATRTKSMAVRNTLKKKKKRSRAGR